MTTELRSTDYVDDHGVRRMRSDTTIRAGGVALIGGALAFVGVFSFLAARFDYPEILDGSAADVLPKLLATGTAGRAVWALYGLLPGIPHGRRHELRPRPAHRVGRHEDSRW
jgi:hypothetical protein